MTKLKEIAEYYGIGSAHTGTVDKYVEQAMKEYATYCCEEQKTICAKDATIDLNLLKSSEINNGEYDAQIKDNEEDVFGCRVNRESILNSPTYKEDGE